MELNHACQTVIKASTRKLHKKEENEIKVKHNFRLLINCVDNACVMSFTIFG